MPAPLQWQVGVKAVGLPHVPLRFVFLGRKAVEPAPSPPTLSLMACPPNRRGLGVFVHSAHTHRKRGGGGGRWNVQKCVYQKWPKSIVPSVTSICSHHEIWVQMGAVYQTGPENIFHFTKFDSPPSGGL